ncbi:hypothetical protein DM860_014729 [Cuscuta australis]|uniref:Uncharacterized protein n=1 Tax=Cuscuta australis TaxID=267555 RepID=A0A328DLV9_9ASTE|nr:hypothetical protein DM860_014729 [Cuscuta australis]
MNSKVLSLCIIAVLETKVALHLHEPHLLSTVKDVFLPICPRFSSIMVSQANGEKKWKRVEVNVADHLQFPTYPSGREPEYYDERLSEYLTKISMDPLPQTRPLWEIHIFGYPTSDAPGSFIFKLHHSLGDGYSLMGALLSLLKRADNPVLPMTLPRRVSSQPARGRRGMKFLGAIPRLLTGVVHTVTDFTWSFMKSSWVDDDRTAVHSGDEGVELRPIAVTTVSISLHHLRQIKTNLNVTINDVITGIVTYGTRLYMQEMERETCNGRCTSLVLFNTRAIGGYKTVAEMIKPNAEMPWGNRFTFLPLAIPKLPPAAAAADPLRFVFEAHRVVRMQMYSASVYLNAQLLEFSRKLRGPEATAKMIRGILKNTSITMSNMIGPVEEATFLNHPLKGIYVFVAGAPQSLTVEMVSYVDIMRLSIVGEKDFIDGKRLKSCILSAFHQIYTLGVN